MKQPTRFVRFGFSLIAMLMVVGLMYAGADTPESELVTLMTQLGLARHS